MSTSDTRHEELSNLLGTAIHTSPFGSKSSIFRDPVLLTASDLESFYHSNPQMVQVANFKPVMADDLRNSLTDRIRTLLQGYIIPADGDDEDTIVPRLSLIAGGANVQPISRFIEDLLVAVVRLGSVDAATFLLEWADGTPYYFWQHHILNGIKVENEFL